MVLVAVIFVEPGRRFFYSIGIVDEEILVAIPVRVQRSAEALQFIVRLHSSFVLGIGPDVDLALKI